MAEERPLKPKRIPKKGEEEMTDAAWREVY